jgi:hypothetical protein
VVQITTQVSQPRVLEKVPIIAVNKLP